MNINMLFKDKMMKMAVRVAKDDGFYTAFKKRMEDIVDMYHIKSEDELYRRVGNPINIFCVSGIYERQDKYANKLSYTIYQKYKKEIIQEFENFLQKNNAKEIFFDNVNRDYIIERYKYNYIGQACGTLGPQPTISDKEKLVYDYLIPEAFFMYTFQWDRTKQGDSTWHRLNRRWCTEYLIFIRKKINES